MTIRSVILGCGGYLPEKILSNEELSGKLETTDEWIQQRTGIKQRHLAAKGEKTSDMAVKAAQIAMKKANITAADIDLIILATTTPDRTFPATAVTVQAKLGIERGFAFDIQAVCSGFVYALAVADNFIRLQQVKHALVIGAEVFSSLLDWQDRSTCVLFGDGAGAVVLKGQESDSRGILSTHLFADGRYEEMLFVDGGPGSTGLVGKVKMVGKEVFKHAVQKMEQAVRTGLEHHKLSVADLDWLVPHQANKRIIEAVGDRLKLPIEKVIVTVDLHANTSAASIPLALAEATADGRIKKGDLVMLEALGGGFTWGSALIRW
ncbi:MAG: ketoacyl-ACP synthase III [Rhodospirillaceae bacterium]|nr:ketoacyl-ACP synthase III [Rhodospirillaceae bacterium]